jgi:hypothetical protein
MTIKDKKLSNIWWKRIFNGIAKKMAKKQTEAPPLPPRPNFIADSIFAVPNYPKPRSTVKKIRAFSSAVLNSLTPAQSTSDRTGRHRRFRWFNKS